MSKNLVLHHQLFNVESFIIFYGSMWIQNVTSRVIDNIECYNKQGQLHIKSVKPREIVEVNTPYYIQSFPMNFKEVDLPRHRINSQRAIAIGSAVLGSLLTLLTQFLSGNQ